MSFARYQSWCGPEGRGFYGSKPCARPRAVQYTIRRPASPIHSMHFNFNYSAIYRLLCRSQPFSRQRKQSHKMSRRRASGSRGPHLSSRDAQSVFETILPARPVAIDSFIVTACALRRGQSSSTWRRASCSLRTPGHSPGRHQRALLYSPLLQDIGWNEPLVNEHVLGPHGEIDVHHDHAHI